MSVGDKDYPLRLSYQDLLWLEKEIKSVTNVTRRDIAEFLTIEAEIPLRPEVQTCRQRPITPCSSSSGGPCVARRFSLSTEVV